jgi:hypothetical protein
VSKIEEIYARINQEIGPEAEFLAHTMITAFAKGFSQDPPGQVNTGEAGERVKDFLMQRVRDKELRFSLDDELPGFLYYSKEAGGDHLLGMEKPDPLMPLLKEIITIYHEEIAETRGKEWFTTQLGRYDQENKIDVSIVDMTKAVYWGLLGANLLQADILSGFSGKMKL